MSVEDALEPLGFTTNEAAVYVQLLRGGRQTGYALAKALGKPAAQVYAALDSLRQKGAVLEGADEPRNCQAVEPQVLLAQLDLLFAARREHAAGMLHGVGTGPRQDDVFRLTAPEQVWARTQRMLKLARTSAVLDCFPEPLRRLAPTLKRTAARGVAVGVIHYGHDALAAPVLSACSPDAVQVVKAIGGSVLQCAVDGAQYLAALFDADGVVRAAFWTESPFLAGLGHNGLTTEIGFTRMRQLAGTGDVALREVESALAPLLWRRTPGFAALR